MSGEHRRTGGSRGDRPGLRAIHLMPVIIVAVGAYFLITGMRAGTLTPIQLKGAHWAGLALMAVGLAASLIWQKKKPLVSLLGVLLCGAGAIMVICL